jgi:zinc transport system permease protein
MLDFLQFAFIQRAFLAGSFIAALCGVLGLFLVLRKMSMIGDGLSHVSFGAIAFGLLLGVYPFYVAIPLVLLSSLLILSITERTKLFGDAAIGIVSAVGISSGVILASLSGGFNIDLMSYIFGNILTISESELVISIILSVIVFAVTYFFYYDLFSATFDEEYASTTGIATGLVNRILVMLTAIVVVLSVKMVGIMLVSALLILPAVTALMLVKGFKAAVGVAVLLAVTSVILGITVSYLADLPAGATIVLFNAAFFGFAMLERRLAGR